MVTVDKILPLLNSPDEGDVKIGWTLALQHLNKYERTELRKRLNAYDLDKDEGVPNTKWMKSLDYRGRVFYQGEKPKYYI